MRPAVEVADILRARGDCFREQNRSWLGYQQLNVLRAITACRTAALGGNLNCEELHPLLADYREYIPVKTSARPIEVAVKSASGFGDVNCCLVLGRVQC